MERRFLDVDCEAERVQGLPPSTLSLLKVIRRNKLQEAMA
jgi:hypothetical protein